jgi:hypothetical protein
MRTPEGYEKDEIKAYLKSIGAYYFMPVQVGYGQATVDILACVKGVFFGIEVKREGKAPTARQEVKLKEIAAGGGITVAGTAEVVIHAIKEWLRISKVPDQHLDRCDPV